MKGDDKVIEDLAMLVRRAITIIKKHAPASNYPAQALDYFQRKGLQGSILRDSEKPRKE